MVVTLITGPRTGIGLATAVLPGRAGHDVYATMRRTDHALQLQTIAKQDALPITVLPLEVDDDDSSGKPSSNSWPAMSFLTWRAAMSDEESVDFGATQDDVEWYARA
jgi:NAD(P)-dependent dehydrogenase (short-subunit alcohol dehydrogenase family)